MPGRRSYYTPCAQTGKVAILTARTSPELAAVIEDAARSLGIPRHRILRAALRLGTPLAIAELTADQRSPIAPSTREE